MDNKNNQNNFPGNQKDCPSGQNKNKNDDKAQQKKNKKEEF